MHPYVLALLSVLLGALWWFIHFLRRNDRRKLPPGPRGLPIIGNLHMLGKFPHRTLQKLSKTYGEIVTLHLGNVTTIIVSSPQAAELFLKTHDNIFASRPEIKAGDVFSYGNKGLAFAPYGAYWRNVRKFCTLELLSNAKVDSLAGMRGEEVGLVVELIKEAAERHEVVDVGEKVVGVIEDIMYRMLFGRKDDRFDMKGALKEGMKLTGEFNIADYIPFLGALDLQGLTRRLKSTGKIFDKILETIINEHEHDPFFTIESRNMDFVDVLLTLKNTSTLTHYELSSTIDRTHIKAIILDMIGGGIETSQTTILWIMSELLRNPRVMKKLQEELKSVVGVDRMVEETDLAKLDYLYMVVKEVYRLHPVFPLLGPHESIEDIVINGYSIPKKSRVIINAWALGRDPNIWSQNVEDFFPERFEDSNIDLRGHDFQLIPFGSGRRGCPGMRLGLTVVQLVVAQLVHCFDWELPNGRECGDMDMAEIFGLSMPRAEALLAIPTYRLL